MRYFLLRYWCVALFLLTSCTSAQKHESEWSGLDSAEGLNCRDWPMIERAIGVATIIPFVGPSTSFLTRYQMRSGSFVLYDTNFSGGSLTVEDDQKREFGKGSIVAGGGLWLNKRSVFIVQPNGNGKKMEIRNIDSNVIEAAVDLPNVVMQDVKAKVHGNEIFVRYRDSNETGDDASEDSAVGFFKVKGGAEKSTLAVVNHVQSLPAYTEFVPVPGNNASEVLAISLTGNKIFSVRNITDAQSKNQELSLPLESQVESWSVTFGEGGFLLAYVDGDSLVGQSNLRIARIDWHSGYHAVRWVKARSLLNQHVADGVWAQDNRNKGLLLIPQWVDKESTLGVYRIGADDIDNVRAAGVFPSSIRVMSAFFDEKEKNYYAVVRGKKKGSSSSFSICNLGKG